MNLEKFDYVGAKTALYGAPLPELVGSMAEALQVSPLELGSQALEDQSAESFAQVAMLCPPGTIERRAALAAGLRALVVGGELVALAPKLRGGNRLQDELIAFGCQTEVQSQRHHKICRVIRPAHLQNIEAAIEAGALRFSAELGLWTQPGVFSWDRIDPGSALLAHHMPRFVGEGADLGCGLGVLAPAVLASDRVRSLVGLDIDRRAIACARANIKDARASFQQADVRHCAIAPTSLDFIVMNPPFHEDGAENQGLGRAFLLCAHGLLRKGGALCLVANRHLPYEATLKPLFRDVNMVAQAEGYKIFEVRK